MPPVTLLIKPASGLCNMRCKYCFYFDEMANRESAVRGIMTDATLELLVRRVFEYAEGSAEFIFQGGEPTLAGLDFYRKLVALQRRLAPPGLDLRNSIQTNGLLIDGDWADFLSENGFLAGVSLDGCAELHDPFRPDTDGRGTYSRALSAAKLLQRRGVPVSILCVVNNVSARHGARLYRSLVSSGFEWLQFIPCIPPLGGDARPFDLSPERYLDFLCAVFSCYSQDRLNGRHVSVRFFDDLLRRLAGQPVASCGMNGRCAVSLTVESDGSVYPCDFYALDRFLLGNLCESTLSGLYSSDAAKRFVSESLPLPPECSGCEYFSLCRGGCRRDRDNGTLPASNRWCGAYREFFRRILQ